MSNTLVAYFSASGTTKNVAEKLASAVSADIFEITPKVPYSKADLDWRNSNSRSSVEMNDKTCRPEISEKPSNMNQYDVVFLGFPVWWYREPSIIDTFIESYDFSGKTIVPFATSGTSPIGNSGANIQALAANAKVDAGKRFESSVLADELKSWASKWI